MRLFNIFVIKYLEVENRENKGEVIFKRYYWKIFRIDKR